MIALDHGKGVVIRNSTAGEGAVVFLGQRDVSDQSLLINNDLGGENRCSNRTRRVASCPEPHVRNSSGNREARPESDGVERA